MAKKAPKQPPHLRIRLEPNLLERLEKSREMHGRTLTGEIAVRLEGSFDSETIRAELQEALQGLAGRWSEKIVAMQAMVMATLNQSGDRNARAVLDLKAEIEQLRDAIERLSKGVSSESPPHWSDDPRAPPIPRKPLRGG